ncbi:hypothetical protein BGLA2_3260005 [Burkholderia gladioli]|nr:hypothetical protein BGLA2_3260005 [Burkholderia gladioli]
MGKVRRPTGRDQPYLEMSLPAFRLHSVILTNGRRVVVPGDGGRNHTWSAVNKWESRWTCGDAADAFLIDRQGRSG